MNSEEYQLLLDPGPEPSTPERLQSSASATLPGAVQYLLSPGKEISKEPASHHAVRRKISSSGKLESNHGQTQQPALPPGRKAVHPGRAAIQQQQGLARQTDKFVPLPKGLPSGDGDETSASENEDQAVAGLSRITAYCIAESFNRKLLDELVPQVYPSSSAMITTYEDCVYIGFLTSEGGPTPRGAFVFDFGVVITFGLDETQQSNLMQQLIYKVQEGAYKPDEAEVDQFQINYSADELPHIKNDTFTVNTFSNKAKAHMVQLAIAYALAQSVRLSVYEEQVWDLVEDTRSLPKILATTGVVAIAPKEVARLIGRAMEDSNVQPNQWRSVYRVGHVVYTASSSLLDSGFARAEAEEYNLFSRAELNSSQDFEADSPSR